MTGRAPDNLNRFNVLATQISELDMDSEHFHIEITVSGKNRSKNITAMIDSGASTLFISKQFVRTNRVQTKRLVHAIPLYNIDGSRNKMGDITHIAELGLRIGKHYEPKAIFTVADIGSEDAIIGIDWLRKHNPEIDWDQGKLTLECCEEKGSRKPTPKKRKSNMAKGSKRSAKGSVVGVDPEWEEGPVGGPVDEEMLFTLEQATIAKSVIPPARFVAGSRYALVRSKEKPEEEQLEWERMGILAGYTHSQQLAEKAHAQDQKKSFEEMVPPQ